MWVILVPVIGGVLVGLIARFGSESVRGHGIPEAMEQVLLNQSRVSPKLVFLKPLASAICIGTGGPFGAEGPIIAAGGALGSFIGQFLKITADERKTLLAAGAAAGVTVIFGSPVAGVLLAVELLLFEFRPQSLIPVALASAAAEAMRLFFAGRVAPVFEIPALVAPSATALICYVMLGALIGIASAGVTQTVHFIERSFEKLPIHWMWWPALGALVIGVVGFFSPNTFGPGYEYIRAILSGDFVFQSLLILCVLKFISWCVGVGSGTSGGTLAPLFMIGAALGGFLGHFVNAWFPQLGVDPRLASLVGMSALFAGSTRALLASIAFAFETTLQPFALLPLLGGCAGSFLVSGLLIKHSLMTEKMARRGFHVPNEFSADFLARERVCDHASYKLVALSAAQTIKDIRDWMNSGTDQASHQGFPVLDAQGQLLGLVTRRMVMSASGDQLEKTVASLIEKSPIVIGEYEHLRQAADLMATYHIGRLPVISHARLLGKSSSEPPGSLLRNVQNFDDRPNFQADFMMESQTACVIL
jgi:H+/Cl- antiporter ClcA